MEGSHQRYGKLDRKSYDDVSRFLKDSTNFTAREWVIARLCSDHRDHLNRAEMKWIGENLPDLVPFMNEEYSRQEVSNARAAFKNKVKKACVTFFYAYYAGLISQDEIIDIIHSASDDVGRLLDMEGEAVGDDHSTEVQQAVVDVLRRMNELKDE